MAAGRVTLCVALALGLVVCSDDPDDSTPSTEETSSSSTTTTAPERPASTTTTAFDPASVEGEVEAAYLKSWDVYADAVYDLVLDEEALAEVYADDAASNRDGRDRGSNRRGARSRSFVSITTTRSTSRSTTTALVVDNYVNHQVLIDPETKEPIEDDPNERSSTPSRCGSSMGHGASL